MLYHGSVEHVVVADYYHEPTGLRVISCSPVLTPEERARRIQEIGDLFVYLGKKHAERDAAKKN